MLQELNLPTTAGMMEDWVRDQGLPIGGEVIVTPKVLRSRCQCSDDLSVGCLAHTRYADWPVATELRLREAEAAQRERQASGRWVLDRVLPDQKRQAEEAHRRAVKEVTARFHIDIGEWDEETQRYLRDGPSWLVGLDGTDVGSGYTPDS